MYYVYGRRYPVMLGYNQQVVNIDDILQQWSEQWLQMVTGTGMTFSTRRAGTGTSLICWSSLAASSKRSSNECLG